jgi:hypothetical protein
MKGTAIPILGRKRFRKGKLVYRPTRCPIMMAGPNQLMHSGSPLAVHLSADYRSTEECRIWIKMPADFPCLLEI